MSRTAVANSAIHLTKEVRSKIEKGVQEKFPDDRILILEPELGIQVIPSE